MELPSRFTNRMEDLLGEEYPSFLECYEKEKKQGLRVNTAKISTEEFLKITPFSLTPIPWVENGFFYRKEDPVTKHPHYYAGLYYVQEPSAMVPASRLSAQPGERVLDLCAAPGGKATELAARLAGQGLLVANDISASRARGLLKNLELAGVPNSLVTAESPEQLLQVFPEFFHRILVDAPCSGEGMFRKEPGLIKSWLERGPEAYAPLQLQILTCAVGMLRPGGFLLYSTCTFSSREDEQVILELLKRFPQMELQEASGYEGFASGFALEDTREGRAVAEKSIRIWPHRMEGEGHYAVLLRKRQEPSELCETEEEKANGEPSERGAVKAGYLEPGRSEVPIEAFGRELQESRKREKEKKKGKRKERESRKVPDLQKGEEVPGELPREARELLESIRCPLLERGQILQREESLFWMPEGIQPPRLRYLRTGLLLGTVKKQRFEPSQALAMALKAEEFSNRIELSSEDPRVIRYLRGETLEAEEAKTGWVLVCCDGYPLGWGKGVNGTIRNKYQPGWRMM